MIKSLFIALSIFFGIGLDSVKEGDIIFQTSQSAQSPLIQYATFSPWSHCGVIIERNKKFYVLEASNVVKLTPLQDWVNRGKNQKYKIKRVTKENVKINYAKYLGYSYDLAFKFDNGKYYCSELVYEIYKNELGIKLCRPRRLFTYNLIGLHSKLKQRSMDLNQLVVAPSDLL